jgi:hypothetical protein
MSSKLPKSSQEKAIFYMACVKRHNLVLKEAFSQGFFISFLHRPQKHLFSTNLCISA